MTEQHKKIVSAVIQKAEALCPDSLELIGVYGSCATGDTHEKSDLDLMILINDEAGRCLAEGFILEDVGIGYDLYCTTWDMLEGDAECEHPYLGKLMDSVVLWVKEPAATQRLEALRRRATETLLSDGRFGKAAMAYERAKGAFAECFLTDSLPSVRMGAAEVIYQGLNALMLSRGRYFRRGVKRTFEEVSEVAPSWDARADTLAVMEAEDVDSLRGALTLWMRQVRAHMAVPLPVGKAEPCRENLAGTYEEMVSNWQNKMGEAAERGDLFSSFMNLASLQLMLDDIAAEVDITERDAMAGFDPRDLGQNAQVFDNVLEAYLEEYRRAGMEPRRFADVDGFLADYLGGISSEPQ